jgi:hypothetical protein
VHANLDPGGPRWISAHCRAPLPQHLMVTPRLPDWLRWFLLQKTDAEMRLPSRWQVGFTIVTVLAQSTVHPHQDNRAAGEHTAPAASSLVSLWCPAF